MADNTNKRQSTNLPKGPGRYRFDRGLYLIVRPSGAGSWFYRYSAQVEGRTVRREYGLGVAFGPGAVSLAAARVKAANAALQISAGQDPIVEKRANRRAKGDADKQAKVEAVTFWEEVDQYIKTHRNGWKNEAHANQWEQSLRDHAAPLHKMPVGAITTEHVLAVLRVLWSTRPETASRLRSRIKKILDSAKVRGLRDGENPARWDGHLELMLPKPSRVKKVRHHAALPWRNVPAFMTDLAEVEGLAARALALTILTAVRTGEAIGARWSEIAGNVWIIPAERTKTSQQHRVPLSQQALAILDVARPLRRPDDFIFPGDIEDWPMSNMAMLMCLRRLKGKTQATVHGFRSSFRDWCADSGVPRELAEACLAHVAGGVERAYYRSDVIDLRRGLMQRWADHCLPAVADENVVLLRPPTADK